MSELWDSAAFVLASFARLEVGSYGLADLNMVTAAVATNHGWARYWPKAAGGSRRGGDD